jgi:multidrug transporter EmrE-like cation transporter
MAILATSHVSCRSNIFIEKDYLLLLALNLTTPLHPNIYITAGVICFFMKKTKRWAALLVLVCTAFTSAAQVFYKAGVNRDLSLDFVALVTNYPIILGLIFYGVGAALLLIALKHGELSVLYPIVALSYIWVSLLASYFFAEPMNTYKWLGVFAIIAGVSLIGRGSD